MLSNKWLWPLIFAILISVGQLTFGLSFDAEAKGQTIFIPPSKGDDESLDNAPSTNDNKDRLILTGGDNISGTVSQITPDGFVHLVNPAIKEPLQVRLGSIRRLTLASKDGLLDGPDLVTLTNDNRIRGQVREITADTVVIQTKSTGPLSVKRNVVASVDFNVSAGVLLDTDFSDGTAGPWQVRSGNWQVQDGKYYSTSHGGWIVASVKQEGPVTFQCTLSAQLNNYITLTLFARDASNYWGRDAFAIRLQPNYINIYQVQNGSTNSIAGKNFNMAPAANTNICVCYDPESGQLRIWMNGADLGQYTINPPVKDGGFVHIYCQNPCGFESISLRYGAAGIAEADKADEGLDQFILANKDKVSGTLETLSGDVAAVQTSYGKLDIKKDQLTSVRFRTKGLEVPRRRQGDVTLLFHDGASLTVQVKRMGADAIEANGEFLGDVKILRKAVREIRFNIYDEKDSSAGAPAAIPASDADREQTMRQLEEAMRAKARAVEEQAIRKKMEEVKKNLEAVR